MYVTGKLHCSSTGKKLQPRNLCTNFQLQIADLTNVGSVYIHGLGKFIDLKYTLVKL